MKESRPPDKPKKESPKPSSAEIELLPDAWERFEKAVDQVAKSPPQHRSAKERAREARARKAK